MTTIEFIHAHSIRGACMCGLCIDAPDTPTNNQPRGHTADVMFFKVASANNPDPAIFRGLIEKEFPKWLDGNEHSYLETGADIGDQGMALQTMGLGHLLGVWQLMTPESMLGKHAPSELKMRMAGAGMVTIKAIG